MRRKHREVMLSNSGYDMMQSTWITPDLWSSLAAHWSKLGHKRAAHAASVQSIKCRANAVLVNGKWVSRQKIMRKETS